MTTGGNRLGTTRDSFDFAIGEELRGERATLGLTLLDAQRDLRIKAVYLAAIEDSDPAVFPNPSFIPGYVRSYARYLGRDPEEVYTRFCAESGFAGPAGAMSDRGRTAAAARGASGGARAAGAAPRATGTFRPDFPMAEKRGGGLPGLAALPVSAIGSVLVMLCLVAGLGYGGWTVLQNIQRVQFAPVEDLPLAAASVEPPPAPEAPDLAETAFAELARPVAATALADLYRQQELEVPILVPRDGPIAGIDPNRAGLATAAAPAAPAAPDAGLIGPVGPVGPEHLAAVAAGPADPLVAAAPDTLTVVAERAAWIRVYLADKTIVFERILETGETYSPPADLAAPLIWAGNSGSVYIRLGDTLRGPLGSGTRSVRDVVLEPKAIAERYAEVEEVPEVISRVFDPALEAAAVALQ